MRAPEASFLTGGGQRDDCNGMFSVAIGQARRLPSEKVGRGEGILAGRDGRTYGLYEVLET